MPRYKVMDGPKKYNGERYEVGAEMEVSEEVAGQLRLEPVQETSSGLKTKDANPGGPSLMNAKEKLKLIGECKTVEDLDKLLDGENRQSIIEAAGKKRARLQGKAGAGN